MPSSKDERRFIESQILFKVKIPRSKTDWQGEWHYFRTEKDAIKAAKENGVRSIWLTVPTLTEIPVHTYHDEDE